jgi:putative sigma-54 modulation protein
LSNVHAVNFNVDGKLVGFVQREWIMEKYYDKVVSGCLFKSGEDK